MIEGFTGYLMVSFYPALQTIFEAAPADIAALSIMI
jgi:hypothetical protein